MEPHGEYKIELIANIVHVFPTGGFNEQGIKKLHKEIASIRPLNKQWVLFEHPREISGLTPESIEELISCYQLLSELNCAFVVLEISPTWQAVFENSIIGKVNIPVYLSDDLMQLEQIIQHELSGQ